MLSLSRFTVGPLQENCYLLFDPNSKDAVFIDPGEEADRLLTVLKQEGLTLKAIWLTHAHFDHIGAVEDICAVHDVPVLLHSADFQLYENAFKAAKLWDIPFKQPSVKPSPIKDNETLELSGTNVSCLFTPGHAPGHIAFYVASQNFVLAGDALFQGSIGRTDLPGANHDELITSIKTKLLTLPDETTVYPGHGPETSLALEKQYNPFLQ